MSKTICDTCGTTANNMSVGNGCHACLNGSMEAQ